MRNATVQALAAVKNRHITEMAQTLYGTEGAEAVLKAAVSPAATNDWGGSLTGGKVAAQFVGSLRGMSAAAELFERGLTLDLSGVGSAIIPRVLTDFPAPAWVAEGAPIPAGRASFESVSITPKKLASLTGLTNELSSLTGGDAEAVIEGLIRDRAARELDATLFSNVAATAVRPAGLLNGVTAITATAGGGEAAFLADMKNLVGAIHTAGGGSGLVLFAAPQQAIAAKIYGGSGFDLPIVTASILTAGTVIAIETRAFASGFTDAPRVEIGKEAVIHYDDTPLQIGTTGAPATVAAPAISAYQTDQQVLRLILRAGYAMRAPGLVQWLSATW
jgi:hypothetical protein